MSHIFGMLGCLTLTPQHTFCMIKMPPAKSNLACVKSSHARFEHQKQQN